MEVRLGMRTEPTSGILSLHCRNVSQPYSYAFNSGKVVHVKTNPRWTASAEMSYTTYEQTLLRITIYIEINRNECPYKKLNIQDHMLLSCA